ncbi:hypothetical protein PVT01_070005500 [Plasmodium vivax]|uniref:Reticulocyte binding protein 2b n=1 Tax=Plasmodium vivax TaxID=5855 RepID=A0A1G4GUQ9_PLAVI|nr:hypothetical protein PVT01_070005500 [Plasmodium vivax]
MLGHIATSANFINIKIIPELTLTESNVNEAVELKFQPDGKVTLKTRNISKSEAELDVHKNIKEAYHLALEIQKYANEIDSQQTNNTQLMVTVNDLHHKIKFINELKNKVKIEKSNENSLSGKVMGISNKIAELDKHSCSEKSYDKFLENTKKTDLQNIRDSFNQEKRNANIDLNLKNIKEDFANSQTSLKIVEQEIEALKANEINTENLQGKSTQIETLHNKIGSIEQNIASLNTSLDKLLNSGKKCEIARYTSLRDSIKGKINADEETIDNLQKHVSQYLTYVEDNYNATVKDVLTLNEHFSNKMVTDHAATNFEKSNKTSEELSTAVNQSKAIINDIKNAFIEVNEKTEFTFNQSSVSHVKDVINVQLKKLEATDSAFKLESINKFHELSDNIKTSIDELEKLEQVNRQEHNTVETHKERITHLMNRRDSLKNGVKEYGEDANLKKLRGDILNQVISDIRNINGELNNSDQLYVKLMKKVDENNDLCKKNYTENYVSEVLQKIDNLNKRFKQNLPEKEKVLQIESNFNEIKTLFGEIKTFYKVEEFVTNMYSQVNGEKERVKDQTNIEKIKLAIQNITNNNEEVKTYLSKFISTLERMNIMKKEMDDLSSSLPTHNTNATENAKRFVNSSVEIINELTSYISKITELKNYAEGVITELEEASKLIRPAANDSNETQMLPTEADSTHQDDSQSDNRSRARDADGRTRYAAAIIGLSLITGVALLSRKHNPDEEEDHHEHGYHEAFEGNDDYTVHDKEEVIEVCFNDSD